MLICKVKLRYKQYYIVLGYRIYMYHLCSHWSTLCNGGVEGGQEGREVKRGGRSSPVHVSPINGGGGVS